MSSFTDDPAEWQRLDWRLLLNGPVALYFSPDVLRADAAWLRASGYVVDAVDCSRWQGADDMHDALSIVLSFPAGYGRNLDALDECLSDLGVSADGGRVLVLNAFSDFATKDPRVAQSLLDSIAGASRRLLLTGRRFLALAHSLDPNIQFQRVGGCAVMWNPREFLDSSRGVSAAT
jgi:hypothetical protein